VAIGELGKVLRHIQVAFDVGTANGLTDRQLVEQFAARGDSASELAFAALVQRHGPMVLRVCHGILRNHQDAEDAFQATLLVLARKAGSLWVRDSIGPWLHGVACRVATSSRAAAARRLRNERGAAIAAWCSDNRVDDNEGLKSLLHEELGRLPERFRTPIVLCDLEGQTYETVARQLGWPLGTVKSRLARGRERLRDRIARRGADVAPVVLIRALSEEKACLSILSTMIDATAQLAMGLNAGSVAIKLFPAATVRLMEGAIKMMFWSKVKMVAASLAIGCGMFSVSVLCFGTGSKADGPLRVPGGVEQGREDKLPNSAPLPRWAPSTDKPDRLSSEPKPWETAVRIRVIIGKSAAVGSGTIIHSTPDQSIILTAAHHFAVGRDGKLLTAFPQPAATESGNSEDGGRPQLESFPMEQPDAELLANSFKGQAPENFPFEIIIDRLKGSPTAKLKQVPIVETIVGQLIDCDFPRDVALVRVRPYRQWAASRIVPSRWRREPGSQLLAVGSSTGRQPMIWLTTITNPSSRVFRERQIGEWIECKVAPERGRAGGGLFTTDGLLAGVCNYGEPADNCGLYAAPSSIYFILERNKLASVYESSEQVEESILDEQIRALEQQIQRETLKLKWWKEQRERAAAERRSRGSRPFTAAPPDHERWLRDVEQHLDRVLKLPEDRDKPLR
jgi:RNA polymerase sigma factor (sigma-70 family)